MRQVGKALRLATSDSIVLMCLSPKAYEDAHIPKYDYANSKLMLYEIDTGAFAQEDANQDMSGVVLKIFAVGV
jgi:hypothetical protein